MLISYIPICFLVYLISTLRVCLLSSYNTIPYHSYGASSREDALGRCRNRAAQQTPKLTIADLWHRTEKRVYDRTYALAVYIQLKHSTA